MYASGVNTLALSTNGGARTAFHNNPTDQLEKNTKSHGWWWRRNGPWWGANARRRRWDKRVTEKSRHGGVRTPSIAIMVPVASRNRVLSRGTDPGCRRSSWKVFAPGRTGRAADSSLRVVECPARTSLNTSTIP